MLLIMSFLIIIICFFLDFVQKIFKDHETMIKYRLAK